MKRIGKRLPPIPGLDLVLILLCLPAYKVYTTFIFHEGTQNTYPG